MRRDSLDAWKSQLSADEIAQIRTVVGRSPDDWLDVIATDAASV